MAASLGHCMPRASSESALCSPLRPGLASSSSGMRKATSVSEGMAAGRAATLPTLALAGIGSRWAALGPVKTASSASLSSLLTDRMARSVLSAASVGAFGAFACGMSLAELNMPAGVVRQALGIPMLVPGLFGVPTHVALHDALWGLAVGALSVGGLLGTRTILALADARGRRKALLVCASLHVLGGLLQASAGAGPVLQAWAEAGGAHSPHKAADRPQKLDLHLSNTGGGMYNTAGGPPPSAATGGPFSFGEAAAGSHNDWEYPSPLLFGAPTLYSSFPFGSSGHPQMPADLGRISWLPLFLLVLGRAASGGACGGYTLLLPVYLGELAPAHARGLLGSAMAAASTAGSTLVQVLGTRSLLGSAGHWPLLPLLSAAAALAQLVLLFLPLAPETESWVATAHARREAKRAAEGKGGLSEGRGGSGGGSGGEARAAGGGGAGSGTGDSGVGSGGGGRLRRALLRVCCAPCRLCCDRPRIDGPRIEGREARGSSREPSQEEAGAPAHAAPPRPPPLITSPPPPPVGIASAPAPPSSVDLPQPNLVRCGASSVNTGGGHGRRSGGGGPAGGGGMAVTTGGSSSGSGRRFGTREASGGPAGNAACPSYPSSVVSNSMTCSGSAHRPYLAPAPPEPHLSAGGAASAHATASNSAFARCSGGVGARRGRGESSLTEPLLARGRAEPHPLPPLPLPPLHSPPHSPLQSPQQQQPPSPPPSPPAPADPHPTSHPSSHPSSHLTSPPSLSPLGATRRPPPSAPSPTQLRPATLFGPADVYGPPPPDIYGSSMDASGAPADIPSTPATTYCPPELHSSPPADAYSRPADVNSSRPADIISRPADIYVRATTPAEGYPSSVGSCSEDGDPETGGGAALGESGDRVVERRMLLAAGVVMTQQLTGPAVFVNYSATMLGGSGVADGALLAAVCLSGGLDFLMAHLSLLLMESAGRRPLLLRSLAATAATLVLMSLGLSLGAQDRGVSAVGPFLACAALPLHAAAFGAGLGPLPWLLASEIFPDSLRRQAAIRLAASSHWIGSLLVTTSAPLLYASLGPLCLLPAVGVALLALVLLPPVLPETRTRARPLSSAAQLDEYASILGPSIPGGASSPARGATAEDHVALLSEPAEPSMLGGVGAAAGACGGDSRSRGGTWPCSRFTCPAQALQARVRSV